jgi:hypothetical protein
MKTFDPTYGWRAVIRVIKFVIVRCRGSYSIVYAQLLLRISAVRLSVSLLTNCYLAVEKMRLVRVC